MSSVKSVNEIDVDQVVGFPHHNSKAKVVNDRGHLRVVERDYYCGEAWRSVVT